MGWGGTVCGAGVQTMKAQGTLPSPRAPLQSLVVNAGEILSTPGMEYCLKHSLGCSLATGLGHTTFAARARLGTQGTSTIAHGADGAVCAGRLHTGSAALLASVDLCCRRFAAIWKGRTVGASTAGLSGAGYTDLQEGACLRARPTGVWLTAADSGRGVAGVPRGLREAG
jgi:hypothetical protein